MRQYTFEMRAARDTCVVNLQQIDTRKCWKEISEICNSKATTRVSCIGCASGDREIVKNFGELTSIMYITVRWMISLEMCFMKEFLRFPTLVISVYL